VDSPLPISSYFFRKFVQVNQEAEVKEPEKEQPKRSRRRIQIGSRRPSRHQGFGWTIIHALGSLKLAMLLFVVIILAAAFGTIAESRFDARMAQHHIYNSSWFTFWLIVLCVNLAAVTLTRLPWKKRHTGFIVTHAGIIVLLIGSIIGKHFGIEGSMTLHVGEGPQQNLFLAEMAIQFGDPRTEQLYRAPFPVDLSPPTEKRPRYMPVPGYEKRGLTAPFSRFATLWLNRAPTEPMLVFDRFTKDLVEEVSVVASPGSPAKAIRLEMRSAMMGNEPTIVELIDQPVESSYYDLGGLAQISFGYGIDRSFDQMENPSPLLQLRLVDETTVEYHAINSRGEVNEGEIRAGDRIETGWADWTATLIEVLPEAHLEKKHYESTTDMNRMAGIHGWLDWGDGRKTEPQWFVAGDPHYVRLGDDQVSFAFGYRREPLPFQVELTNFEVPRDEGTDNPANYTSYLRFTDRRTGMVWEDTCGMNVPAVFPPGFHRLVTGYTYKFSQASWNPEDLTQSTVQVLRDPGWLFKWIGSLLIIVGIYLIFFKRSYRARRPEDIIDEIDVEQLNAPSGKGKK